MPQLVDLSMDDSEDSVEDQLLQDKQNNNTKSNVANSTTANPYADIKLDKSIDFDSINDILKKVFGHEGFRTKLQHDAVVQTCRFENDLFVSLPTGSGKSLIYQLPALYRNYGLTIVVSPLVALISNQILNARKLGIPCATINSHMTKSWNAQVRAELKNKTMSLRLLYITPETLCSDNFRPCLSSLNKSKMLKLFAIDEAHCVSSWGHEFRPDYLKLGQLRTLYPSVPIVALTATATSKVLKDILKVLNLREPKHIIASSFRKNLFYDVKHTDKLPGGVLNDLSNFIMECLKIKKEKVKTSSRSGFKRASSMLSSSSSSVGSQFVSAASLLTSEKILAPKTSASAISKKSRRVKESITTQILAKEPARITSFFKPQPIEVVDLCSGDGDDDVVLVKNKTLSKDGQSESSSTVIKRSISSSNMAHSNRHQTSQAGGVGIVYCRTKLACEDVAEHLSRNGISAKPYHSGLTSKQRTEIETLWMDEKVLVICATISFGMGIDKANVRVVVHYNMSQSLANYYQESGRAGRDGKQAHCRLYYSQSDQSAIVFLLRKDMELENSEHCLEALGSEVCRRKQETARAAMERFEKMVEYCKSSNKCRHQVLAKEFALADESTRLLINGCGKSCDCCFRTKKWCKGVGPGE